MSNDRVMRKGKTLQDRLPVDRRERASNATRVYNFSKQHRPRRSADWNSFKTTGH